MITIFIPHLFTEKRCAPAIYTAVLWLPHDVGKSRGHTVSDLLLGFREADIADRWTLAIHYLGSVMPTSDQPLPREKIGGYRPIRKIGHGGMGEVYEARHEGVGGRAAIKILRLDVASVLLIERFFDEARAAIRSNTRASSAFSIPDRQMTASAISRWNSSMADAGKADQNASKLSLLPPSASHDRSHRRSPPYTAVA